MTGQEKLNLWHMCRKGASILDKKLPDWYKNIDPNFLDFTKYGLGCDKGCVSGLYSKHTKETAAFLENLLPDRLLGVLGITFAKDNERNKKLIQYWTTLINQRKDRI